MTQNKKTLDRIIACFKGLITGDAIGKQTETLSRKDIKKWYPEGIKGFQLNSVNSGTEVPHHNSCER